MSTAGSFLSATVLGSMAVLWIFLSGCASTRAVGEPPGEAASPPPVVAPAPSPPIGPPPGYVKTENYWMREKIILTSEPALPASATPKSSVKKGKKTTKTGSRVPEPVAGQQASPPSLDRGKRLVAIGELCLQGRKRVVEWPEDLRLQGRELMLFLLKVPDDEWATLGHAARQNNAIRRQETAHLIDPFPTGLDPPHPQAM
jgi:hypothetical protein